MALSGVMSSISHRIVDCSSTMTVSDPLPHQFEPWCSSDILHFNHLLQWFAVHWPMFSGVWCQLHCVDTTLAHVLINSCTLSFGSVCCLWSDHCWEWWTVWLFFNGEVLIWAIVFYCSPIVVMSLWVGGGVGSGSLWPCLDRFIGAWQTECVLWWPPCLHKPPPPPAPTCPAPTPLLPLLPFLPLLPLLCDSSHGYTHCIQTVTC